MIWNDTEGSWGYKYSDHLTAFKPPNMIVMNRRFQPSIQIEPRIVGSLSQSPFFAIESTT